MSVSTDNEELDYYIEIIDFFQNSQVDSESIEIWINKLIIELMKVLKRTHNKEFVRNALIFLISLFKHVPPDFYNQRGANTKSLKEGEKKLFISQLKAEFVNELPN